MLWPAHHGVDEIAVVEVDLERHAGEIGGGQLKRRLRQVDAVIVADFGAAQRRLHHAGVAAGDVEEGEGRLENLVQGRPQDGADLAVGQVIAFDHLAVGRPLLLELRQRRGVDHGAAGLELMDVNVDQVRTLLVKPSALLQRDRDR
jgi:hypothetical protein